MKARVNASGDTLARIRELEAELAEEHRQNVRNLARAEKAKRNSEKAEKALPRCYRRHSRLTRLIPPRLANFRDSCILVN